MRSEMEEMADLKRIPEKHHKYYINNKDLINQITVGNRGDKFAYNISKVCTGRICGVGVIPKISEWGLGDMESGIP